MEVLHYIPSIDRTSGGVGSYMQLLSKELGRLVDLHIITHASENELSIDNAQIHYIQDAHFLFSKARREFNQIIDEIKPDIFHTNCCWLPLSALTLLWAKKKGYKTIYTPHGMLEPWILKRNYLWKKFPAMLLYQKKALRMTDIIHSTAESEKLNIQKLNLNSQLAVIPNGIDIREIQLKPMWEKNKRILFLSRIHPKKGINFLIEAAAILRNQLEDYEILIAGEGDESYINDLKDLAKKKGVSNIVQFIGGVYGEEKWNLYKTSDIFVLPTYSENFGIVVAEALASGTPVITTKGTPWEELNTHNCGWWTEIGTEATTQALEDFLSKSAMSLQQMGLNGRRLVEENYAMPVIAQKMLRLYEWVLHGGEKPEFVYLQYQ